MTHHSRIPSRLALCYASAPFLLISAGSAWAQEQERSPYYIGISQEFTHDSNVLRTPTNQISETISSTGILAGFDQPIGRQRVYGSASGEINRYRKVDALDNKSYAAALGLDWQTVEFLSGSLRYNVRNSLADFGTLDGATSASDQTTQQFLASVRYGLSSRLAFTGSVEHRELEYENSVYANRNYTQNAASAGVEWGTMGVLVFGVAFRATEGRTPQYLTVPPYEDTLKRRDIDFTTVWTPSGFSTLSARLSSTKETHSLAASAEVSAITGALSWSYRPTAKIDLVTSLIRDTGTETTFLGRSDTTTGTQALPVDSNRLSTTAALEVRYAATSKISLRGEARYRDGTLGSRGDETISTYGLGLSYAPTRNTTLGCSVTRESREASGTVPSFTATVSGCSAQVTLR